MESVEPVELAKHREMTVLMKLPLVEVLLKNILLRDISFEGEVFCGSHGEERDERGALNFKYQLYLLNFVSHKKICLNSKGIYLRHNPLNAKYICSSYITLEYIQLFYLRKYLRRLQ